MKEVKTYGFLIGLDECIKKRQKLMVDMKKAKGFVGVTPEPTGAGQVLLFLSKEERNEAMKYFKREYDTVRKIPVEIYVDAGYVEGTKKYSHDDYGDTDFSEMMKELEEDMKAEAKKEYEEELREKNNIIGTLKSKIADQENIISNLEYQVKETKDSCSRKIEVYERDKKILNGEIKELKAEVNRLYKIIEKENV